MLRRSSTPQSSSKNPRFFGSLTRVNHCYVSSLSSQNVARSQSEPYRLGDDVMKAKLKIAELPCVWKSPSVTPACHCLSTLHTGSRRLRRRTVWEFVRDDQISGCSRRLQLWSKAASVSLAMETVSDSVLKAPEQCPQTLTYIPFRREM
ncbi:hypothetical protein RB195_019665 [Necator americanus]|uniref:Uncharacterized protein n=1 Tax=Necator americanus TaxID=51031 RepID=A0ABR1CF75_NECAM